MTQPVFRFAPSPNGRLHLGHAYSALLNAELAAASGGRFLVRIEDIDPTRCRPEFEQAIYDDLAWLGLAWKEPVRRQSEHIAEYAARLDELKSRGLVFPCFCSRKAIAAAVSAREAETAAPWRRDPDGAPLYPGICRDLKAAEAGRRIAAGAAHAWRLDIAAALAAASPQLAYRRLAPDAAESVVTARPERWGDTVMARKEVPTSYHLSVVLDDAVQGVTHVVRGQDLEAATDLHVLLQDLLRLPTPRYRHHPLIRDSEGDKLSKSLLSESLAELRARGVSAAEVRRRLGFEAHPTPST
ncbi:MAG: tRNA glutamyl-Q(34) synthetase GluQRS [Microvirga sp.]